MRRWMMFSLMVAVITVLASPAKAVPVAWSFVLESLDENGDSWSSTTAVDTGFPQYDYELVLTHAKIMIEPSAPTWIDIPDQALPPAVTGSKSGLPFVLTEPLHVEIPDGPGVIADIYASVDENGYAEVFMLDDDVTFGTFGGFAVTAVHFEGTFTVTPIPEPATAFLLGLGGLVLLRKRRRQSTA